MLAASGRHRLFLDADNSALVEEDFNESTYTGARISALWDINDNWSALLSFQRQEIESDGVFFADPDLGAPNVERFSPDSIQDDFDNAVATGGRGTPWSVVIGANGQTFPLSGAQPIAAVQQLIQLAGQ